MPVDPFASSTDRPRVEKFFVRATNSYNHAKEVTVAFPPEMKAAILAMVERVAEYKTPADLMRDAVHHRLLELDDWYGAEGVLGDGVREQLELAAEQDRFLELAEIRARVIKGATETFEKMYEMGDAVQMKAAIDRHRMSMALMDEYVVGELLPIIEQAERDLERMRS